MNLWLTSAVALLPALAAAGLMAAIADLENRLVAVVVQAPDVAYSELAVNTVALPWLFLVTLAAARINQRRRQAKEG